MKKNLFLCTILAFAITALYATTPVTTEKKTEDTILSEPSASSLYTTFDVTKGGKKIGYVSVSVEFQETSRGIFAHCTLENNSDEWVEVSLYNIDGVRNESVGPWKTKKVTGGTDTIPKKITGSVYCK